MILGFRKIQKCYNMIVLLIEAMYNLHEDLPCFAGKSQSIKDLKDRIFPVFGKYQGPRVFTKGEATMFIDNLIAKANNSWSARAYDYYQYCCQGIY